MSVLVAVDPLALDDIVSDCSDVCEIVHCDIGWCMSPAVAPLILGYPASATHLDSVDASAVRVAA